MKKRTLLFSLVIFLFSCRSPFPVAYDSVKAKNPEYKSYIKTKAGEMIVGDTIFKKNETKLFTPVSYTLNDKTFKAKEIKEYQDASGLYVNIEGGMTKALTGPRIHVFRKTEISSSYSADGGWKTRQVNYYYIKKAGQDPTKLVGLGSATTLREWVEDNEEAHEQATLALKYSRSVKRNQLFNWAGVIGGLTMIAVDKDVTALSYAGLGLMCGGIINMPINLFVRRGKAGRAYADAINLYNIAPVKKGKK